MWELAIGRSGSIKSPQPMQWNAACALPVSDLRSVQGCIVTSHSNSIMLYASELTYHELWLKLQ